MSKKTDGEEKKEVFRLDRFEEGGTAPTIDSAEPSEVGLPVHWFTFPKTWVVPRCDEWEDLDTDFFSEKPDRSATVQIGFREDGVVVWRKKEKENAGKT